MTATIAAPMLGVRTRTRITGVVPALTARRLALTIRSPRAVAIPVLAPLMFALIVAPALGNTIARAGQHTTYMTFVALAGAGLLIPLNCMFSGLGVLTDRAQGAMRELLVAPIQRSAIVLANLIAALVVTAAQVAVLILAAAIRGADFRTGMHLLWFLAAGVGLAITVYSVAEMLAAKISAPEEFTGLIPAIAIIPFFFAGTLYPITSLPGWLAGVAKVLPLTHAMALFRYGLTGQGAQALHNIWRMSNTTTMASLSLVVVAAYAGLAFWAALRVFLRAGMA